MSFIRFKIPPEYDGFTVERYLKGAKEMSSRTLSRLKRTGNGLLLNNTHVRTIDTVRCGDILEVNFADDRPAKPTYCIDIDIAYEDNEYLVCNKSGDMATHPSISHSRNTLVNGVAAYIASKGEHSAARPMNRLDLDTSGLVVFAKHQYAASLLTNNLHKSYYALAEGIITGAGIIEAPIARRDDRSKYRVVSPYGEYALSKYFPIASENGTTLLKVILKTGRTHQIRVHFSYIGHPLVGDRFYGNESRYIDRQCLHCGAVSFYNKISEKYIKVNSCYPDDFKRALSAYEYSKSIIQNEVDL